MANSVKGVENKKRMMKHRWTSLNDRVDDIYDIVVHNAVKCGKPKKRGNVKKNGRQRKGENRGCFEGFTSKGGT